MVADAEEDWVSAFSESVGSVLALMPVFCGGGVAREEPTEGRKGEGLEVRVGGFIGWGGGSGVDEAMRKMYTCGG
jgi:hypothetical protein